MGPKQICVDIISSPNFLGEPACPQRALWFLIRLSSLFSLLRRGARGRGRARGREGGGCISISIFPIFCHRVHLRPRPRRRPEMLPSTLKPTAKTPKRWWFPIGISFSRKPLLGLLLLVSGFRYVFSKHIFVVGDLLFLTPPPKKKEKGIGHGSVFCVMNTRIGINLQLSKSC